MMCRKVADSMGMLSGNWQHFNRLFVQNLAKARRYFQFAQCLFDSNFPDDNTWLIRDSTKSVARANSSAPLSGSRSLLWPIPVHGLFPDHINLTGILDYLITGQYWDFQR